jgi:hypothetical protein
MTAEAIDPKRLIGACRQISCYLGEHEIVKLDKLFEAIIATAEQSALTDGLAKLRRAMTEGMKYPALTDEEIAAA